MSIEDAFPREQDRQVVYRILSKYPDKRSAILPLLTLAQEINGGWLSSSVLRGVSLAIEIPYSKVLETASFYDMFELSPPARLTFKVCTNVPCWLSGSDHIVSALEKVTGQSLGEKSKDYEIRETECLGLCTNAPVLWSGNEILEKITPEKAISFAETKIAEIESDDNDNGE